MANLPKTERARPARKTKQAVKAELDRQQRLTNALRENLVKRKQQSRFRQQQKQLTEDSSTRKNKGMQD